MTRAPCLRFKYTASGAGVVTFTARAIDGSLQRPYIAVYHAGSSSALAALRLLDATPQRCRGTSRECRSL